MLGGIAASIASAALAGATLDPTFGNQGTASVPLWVKSIVGQADGRLLLTGQATSYGLVFATSIAAARLLDSGLPDTEFAFADFPELPGHVKDTVGGIAALQADGKFVLAGMRNEQSSYRIAAARFQPDGQVDASFVVAGLGDMRGSGRGAVVQSGGAIVISGGSFLVRLAPDGSIDPGYGTGGIAVLPLGEFPNVMVQKVLLLPDDRVMVLANPNVCGASIPPSCPPSHLIRVTADGQLDATFNGTGQAAYPSVLGADLALLPDGRVLVAWNDISLHPSRGRLQRLMPDGSIDATFGEGGIVNLRRPGDTLVALEVEGDGSIIGLGWPFTLLRWSADGVPEGRIEPVLPGRATASALAARPDGKRVAAGEYESTVGRATTLRSLIVRFDRGTTDMAAAPELFVAQQYRDLLGREADTAGLDFWAGRLASEGFDRAGLVNAILGTPEFERSPVPMLTRLYLALLLRAPDPEGLRFWVGYSREHSIEDIANAMAASYEFLVRYGALANREFVDRIYRDVLGRAPDAPGLQFWTSLLDAGTRTRGAVLLAFSESEEYRGSSAGEVEVASLYAALLARPPQAGEVSRWIGHLDSGGSRLEIVRALLGSAEYHGRFIP